MSDTTHWKQNFNYTYTGAYELAPNEERTLTISSTSREEVQGSDGKKEMCFVARFAGSSKPMILNKTNCKTLEKLYGPYVEAWIGKRVIIKAEKVKAFGDVVEALRIKKTVPQPEKAIDIEPIRERLELCESLDQLKNTYTALTPAEKAATIHIKDAVKAKLTEGSAA